MVTDYIKALLRIIKRHFVTF